MKQHILKVSITGVLGLILMLSYQPSFGQSGNNLIIDDFSNDQAIVFVTLAGTNPDGSSAAAANAVGGERDLTVEVSSGSNANAEIAQGTFNLSVGANSTGSSTIVYDGADGDPFTTNFTGLNNLDLTNGGTEDRYKISVISADHPGSFTIEVYTDGANSSSVTKEFAENMQPTNFQIFFSEFTTATGSGADFTNVGAIVIKATGEPEIDLIIDRICTEGPPPTCDLTSLAAGAPTCLDNFTDYTVTVSWTGADGSVTLTAGGAGSPASINTSDRDGSQTFTYPLTDLDYNITYSDSDGLCSGLGSGLSGSAPECAPPPACELTSISAGDPSCIEGNFTNYTVTVTWAGADASVTLSAGGAGSPASVTTSARDGSQTFTYPLTDSDYNISYSDSEGLCSGLGSNLSGNAPTCEPPRMCEISNITGEKDCLGESAYTVTVSWSGSDESVTLVAGGSGSPASVATTVVDGSQVFTYPIEEDYNITVSDSEGLCTGNISGSNPSCFIGVPTMGEWGLISLSIIFLIFGTMAMRQYVFKPSVTK